MAWTAACTAQAKTQAKSTMAVTTTHAGVWAGNWEKRYAAVLFMLATQPISYETTPHLRKSRCGDMVPEAAARKSTCVCYPNGPSRHHGRSAVPCAAAVPGPEAATRPLG